MLRHMLLAGNVCGFSEIYRVTAMFRALKSETVIKLSLRLAQNRQKSANDHTFVTPRSEFLDCGRAYRSRYLLNRELPTGQFAKTLGNHFVGSQLGAIHVHAVFPPTVLRRAGRPHVPLRELASIYN
jgi:hypothetical protein